MAEDFSIEDGKHLAKKVLQKMGFEEVEFKTKKATSKYYALGSEFEVFVKHPRTGERVEIGNAGHYSPVSLANYDISRPVFNFGIGLERVLMIRTGQSDIRELVYPYRYKDLEFSDEEISRMLEFEREPETESGRKLAEDIVRLSEECQDEPSPCEFELPEVEIGGKEVSVSLVEPEENTELIGPAAFNTIFVTEGNVVGVPPGDWGDNELLNKAREGGVSTGLRYIDAIANLAARKIEDAVESGESEVKVRVPMIESLSDVNLRIEKLARRFITDNNKKIDVRGPVFTTIKGKIGTFSSD